MDDTAIAQHKDNTFPRMIDFISEYQAITTVIGLLILSIVPYIQYVGYRYALGHESFETGKKDQSEERLDQALLAYERAIQFYTRWVIPDSRQIIDAQKKVGGIYSQRNEHDMAIQHLEPVYKKQPNDTEVRNMLSKAYHARGQSEADHANFDKAKQDYRKAYEVHNTKEYREAANAKLETVKISGDVRDDEGKPISHAEIRTHGRKVEEGTDEDGNFAVDVQSLSPGRVPVSISAEDHGPYSENIIIEIESGKYEYTLSAVLMRGGPMVLIPAGEFQMGSDDGSNNERPIHTVYLDAFYMDVHEVTNAQYKAFMDTTKHPAPRYLNDSNFNAPNQPVVGVSWYDAATYCQWAGKRLPTEAEWEKAARGGLVGARYPWGDEEPEQARVSYNPNAANPALVGSYPPNGYGLYDMAGNVWEWCLDEYQADFYAKSAKENPFPEGDIDSAINNFTSITVGRVLRGGSWVNDNLRVAARHRFNPSFTFNFVGFRCARALNP